MILAYITTKGREQTRMIGSSMECNLSTGGKVQYAETMRLAHRKNPKQTTSIKQNTRAQ